MSRESACDELQACGVAASGTPEKQLTDSGRMMSQRLYGQMELVLGRHERKELLHAEKACSRNKQACHEGVRSCQTHVPALAHTTSAGTSERLLRRGPYAPSMLQSSKVPVSKHLRAQVPLRA